MSESVCKYFQLLKRFAHRPRVYYGLLADLGRESRIERAADLRLGVSKIIESEEVAPGIILDFNNRNKVVALEMLNLSNHP